MSRPAVVEVAIGEVAFLEGQGVLLARGLGSCVAVVIYAADQKRAGMAHIFLQRPPDRLVEVSQPGKYATTAIHYLISRLLRPEAAAVRLQAYMVGGASLFAFSAPQLEVGRRNVETVRELLRRQGVPLVLDDTGGTRGRTFAFDVATGRPRITVFGEDPVP